MVTKAADIDIHVCPKYHAAVELIGRRWTGAILSAMLMGATRFTDIIHAVPGLSDRLLSERLKELEATQIVERIVHPETPVRIEYRLTEKGHELNEAIASLSAWAERWAGDGTHVW
jgi:DNA-binding HxlR family transcriptional regulator